ETELRHSNRQLSWCHRPAHTRTRYYPHTHRAEGVAMSFDPHLATRAAIAEYFAARAERFPNLQARVEEFFAAPSLETGKQLLRTYFRNHTVGEIASLRMVTSAFADKRLVRAVVESILNDDAALAGIAARSYPHPIGFDKLVLEDCKTGFKFRLHIYW